MRLGFGLSLTGRGFGGAAGSAAKRMTLAARPARRGMLLEAMPARARLRGWVNDPAYADRVGDFQSGGPFMALQSKLFADIFTFGRASKAWDFDASGLLNEVQAGSIRQGYDPATLLPAGWLLEGASTNGVRDPRFEAVTPGTGTTTAASGYWSIFAAAGLSYTVTKGVVGNTAYVDYRIFGTAASSAYQLVTDVASTALGTLTPGADSVAYGISLAEPLGPGVGVTSVALSAQFNGGTTGNPASGANIKASLTAGLTRKSVVGITPGDRTGVWGIINFGVTAGATIDYTLRIAAPQLEKNYYASSIILPAVGTPAATTRAADSLAIDGPRFNALWPAQDLRTNVVQQSEAFDNAAWVKTGVAVSANATTDPFGGSAAEMLTEDASTGSHRLLQGATFTGALVTASAYFKAGTRSKASIAFGGGATAGASGYAVFDLAAGTIFSRGPDALAVNILAVGSGWFRCSLTVQSLAVTSGVNCEICDAAGARTYAGDNASTLYVHGAQLEATPVAPSANLLTYPEQFDNAVWGKTAATAPAIASPLGPDLFPSANKLTEDATTSGHYVQQGFNATAGQPYTFTVYAKAAERAALQLIVTGLGAANGNIIANFDLTNGVASVIGGGAVAITAAGNGWYRCALSIASASQTVASGAQIRTMASYAVASGADSHAGTLGSGVLIFGAQIANAAAAPAYVFLSALVSPYIATAAAAASKYVGTAKEGWVIVDVMLPQSSGLSSQHFIALTDGSLANRITLFNSGSSVAANLFASNVSIAGSTQITAGSFTPGVPFRIGMKWANNTITICKDGAAPAATPLLLPPFLNQINLGASVPGAATLNGRILGAFAGAVAPSDAKFQAMCAANANIDAVLAA